MQLEAERSVFLWTLLEITDRKATPTLDHS